MAENQRLFALLIDGDNINSKKIHEILGKISSVGKILIKRVYVNKLSMEQWEPVIGKYSLFPVWVPNNTKNKNSVDIALAVEAMSLLYERTDLNGFCIVSSDADYTALVKHIRTKDKEVWGIGNGTTPEPFRNACTQFIDLDKLVKTDPPVEEIVVPPIPEISDRDLVSLLIDSYRKVSKIGNSSIEDGWVQLLELKAAMIELNPSFQLNSRLLAERLKGIAKAFPNRIEVDEQTSNKLVTHRIRLIFMDPEAESFMIAYKHAIEELKLQDEKGWVKLSVIGETLQALFPDYNPLVYHGIKYKQLKKVVEKLVVDNPDVFELKADVQTLYLRVK